MQVATSRDIVFVAGPCPSYDEARRIGLIMGTQRGMQPRCEEGERLARDAKLPIVITNRDVVYSET